ncbi:enoyl-CoA hydratase [Mesorhizobium xinjiangense]|uniref:enoyl-CoA hydratase n=1 Tax=Mesorhizobium xinjiangense TaxID=2678685 RepID=UPI0012EDE9FE|nr:enoyl-CoA hydratase [Mesorhizobium xinjiangense]
MNAPAYETDEPVLTEIRDGVAWLTMNRPRYNNAQNSQMTYALDTAIRAANDDPEIKVMVLRGAGKHFSAGHDIGTPGRDIGSSFARVGNWYDHAGLPGAEMQFVREVEVYLGMCRRWREGPKPMIAMVHGACIAGGLMLAWICDLIVASEDARFADPVLRMGFPGVEYFAHAFELPPRVAREMVLLAEPISAERAYNLGMVNRLVARDHLEEETAIIAKRIASMPRFGLALTRHVFNATEDIQGKRAAMDMAYGYHHTAHAHNSLTGTDNLSGISGKDMARMNKERDQ